MAVGRVTRGRAACAATGFGVVALTTGLAGCSDDKAPSIDVTLGEFVVEPDPTSVDAGEVELVGDNGGGERHELVIVRAADADALPTDEDGAVVEDDLAEGAVIGEIEDIDAGDSKSATFDLETGDYVLFCNITEENDSGEIESHFEKGMHATLKVK